MFFWDKDFGKVVGRQRWYMLLIILLVTVASYGFNYVNWTFGNSIFGFLTILLSYYCLVNLHSLTRCNFGIIVLIFIFLPFFAIINSYTIYGQSVFIGMKSILPYAFVWVLYFALHILKVKESTILKAFLLISLFVVALQIIQQFTYPNVYFGIKNQKEALEYGIQETADMRNGLLRFRILGMEYTVPIIILLFLWIMNKAEMRLILLFTLLLTSVYLTLTRQLIFSTIFTIIFTYFLEFKKVKIWFIIIGILSVIILFLNYDSLFGEFVNTTRNEANENNIRVIAASFFWNDSLRSWSTFLFGYGPPSSEGSFHNYVEQLSLRGLYSSDVGFIGVLWRFGILYVILSFYLLFTVFFKLKEKIPTYIRLFVVFVSVISIMIFPFGANYVKTLVWPFLLYICDLHINKSPLIMHTK